MVAGGYRSVVDFEQFPVCFVGQVGQVDDDPGGFERVGDQPFQIVGGARLRPVPLVRFVGHFVGDLVSSGAMVAWQTLRPAGIDRSAIITVQLRTDSDLLLTILSESLTLVPGSMVIDLDRERRTLALHILHVRDEADVERQRESVLAEEERVVRAFGSPAEVAALDSGADVAAEGRTP